jgi:hypothetical protein
MPLGGILPAIGVSLKICGPGKGLTLVAIAFFVWAERQQKS